jgi:hypothetical protein
LITGVESTFDEVTVDSPPFKSKIELGTGWAMLHQRCHRWASVNIRPVATTLTLRIATESPLPRAAASIESP